jgi:hypothetical protein
MTSVFEGATMLDHALKWVDRGFAVFPCRPRGKAPEWRLVPKDKGPDGEPIDGTGGFKKATRDPAVIRDWWGRIPNANIGVATGDGFFILDLDGDEAQRWFINACGRHGEPDPTLTVKTRPDRSHLYFWAPLEIPNSTSRLAPHVDIRGAGGYAVAPPSIHPDTGHAYQIIHDLPIAEATRWLTDLAMPDPVPRPALTVYSNERPMQPSLYQSAAALKGVLLKVCTANEGNRNGITFWAACRCAGMVADGLITEQDAAALLVEAATRTGLSAKEASITVRSAFKTRARG